MAGGADGDAVGGLEGVGVGAIPLVGNLRGGGVGVEDLKSKIFAI